MEHNLQKLILNRISEKKIIPRFGGFQWKLHRYREELACLINMWCFIKKKDNHWLLTWLWKENIAWIKF